MNYFFSVAGHIFSIRMNDRAMSENLLYHYQPFLVDEANSLLFELDVIEEDEQNIHQRLSFDRIGEEPPFTWHRNENGKEIYGFSCDERAPQAFLEIMEEKCRAELYFGHDVSITELSMGLDNAVMLLYALFSSLHGTLLLHSSVVMNQGRGYAFLGESGTGKSTHSDLWVRYIPGTSILNDDNPVLRVMSGRVNIFGSPWSGKRDIYINQGCTLKGLVMLEQASVNCLEPLNGVDAFIALLTSCFCIQWNEQMKERVHDIIADTVNHCRVYHLQCLPNREAAVVCHTELKE